MRSDRAPSHARPASAGRRHLLRLVYPLEEGSDLWGCRRGCSLFPKIRWYESRTVNMWPESHSSHPRNRYLDTVRHRDMPNMRRVYGGRFSPKIAVLVAAVALAVGASRGLASERESSNSME